jgi:pantoate--beta-alanine ligase
VNVITTVAEMETQRARLAGTVGLVPTMGYLHEGHLSLVRRALKQNDHTIVSIFVNPTQFGPNEDLARYPRDLDRDLELLESVLGTQHLALVFAPTPEEMYPPGFDDWVEVTGPLTERLEGSHRPGHFRGVTTVVARLFGIIRPHRAYFGQKDAQQLRVIRRMVKEQRMDVEINPMPTVREPDGLAVSSRNVYLSPEERKAALGIPRALALARRLVMDEGVTDAETVRQAVRARINSPLTTHYSLLTLDYVSVSNEQTLEELETIDRPALVLLAARVGATRLIDNTILIPQGMPIPGDLSPLVQSDSALNVTLDT